MHPKIEQLNLWFIKEQMVVQIEKISESADWYRGGRKIGDIRRAFKKVATTTPEADKLFDTRILAAHQTYMDRLALHKLKGPTNQQSLKNAEIARLEQQSHLLQEAVHQAEMLIDGFQQTLTTHGGQDREEVLQTIKQVYATITDKKHIIRGNQAMVESLSLAHAVMGCSATIKTV